MSAVSTGPKRRVWRLANVLHGGLILCEKEPESSSPVHFAKEAPGSLEAVGTPLSQFPSDATDAELETSVIHTPNHEVKS
jgi:hypothetical protein